ncbi:hypothetical protein SBP28_003774 [Candidozyma auris]
MLKATRQKKRNARRQRVASKDSVGDSTSYIWLSGVGRGFYLPCSEEEFLLTEDPPSVKGETGIVCGCACAARAWWCVAVHGASMPGCTQSHGACDCCLLLSRRPAAPNNPLCAGRIPVHSVSKLRVCTSGGLACSFPGPLLSFFFTCFLKYMSKISPLASSLLRPSCSQAGDRPISSFPPSFYLSLFLSVLSCDPLQPLPTVAGSLLIIAETFTTTLCCWDLLFPPFPL